jgi:hypothetical protein
MVNVQDNELVDLSHLLPGAQAVARLPGVERVAQVRADRWIGYSRATDTLQRLGQLYTWPTKQRMPNLLLIGPTNNGKSMIIEKFRRTHPPVSNPDHEDIPVLVVQMPSEPSVTRFYVSLLAAMGAPLRPRTRLAELERVALSVMRRVGVRVLVIDELHNILAGGSVSRREFLNLLRFLGNELRIPLVVDVRRWSGVRKLTRWTVLESRLIALSVLLPNSGVYEAFCASETSRLHPGQYGNPTRAATARRPRRRRCPTAGHLLGRHLRQQDRRDPPRDAATTRLRGKRRHRRRLAHRPTRPLFDRHP